MMARAWAVRRYFRQVMGTFAIDGRTHFCRGLQRAIAVATIRRLLAHE
jgi:hypothetical protein